MKMTIRTSVFETNSSSMHTFVHVSRRTFDEWKRGEKILKEGCLYKTYGEDSFITKDEWEKCDRPIGCTYEDVEGEVGCDLLFENADDTELLIFISGRHNDAVAQTIIRTDKNAFEAWKRGEVILRDGELTGVTYGSSDFIPVKKGQSWIETYAWGGTYEGMLEYCTLLEGDLVLKREAKEEYVDPEEWRKAEDDHLVFQNRYMETEDDGKNVTVRIWGRCNE